MQESSTRREYGLMGLWGICVRPPAGGIAPWACFSKSNAQWGVLPFPLFSTKEEADTAFTENASTKRSTE